MYSGFEGDLGVEQSWESEDPAIVCRCELSRCTNVVFPEPAIPIVIITVGFFLCVGANGVNGSGAGEFVVDDEAMVA